MKRNMNKTTLSKQPTFRIVSLSHIFDCEEGYTCKTTITIYIAQRCRYPKRETQTQHGAHKARRTSPDDFAELLNFLRVYPYQNPSRGRP